MCLTGPIMTKVLFASDPTGHAIATGTARTFCICLCLQINDLHSALPCHGLCLLLAHSSVASLTNVSGAPVGCGGVSSAAAQR